MKACTGCGGRDPRIFSLDTVLMLVMSFRFAPGVEPKTCLEVGTRTSVYFRVLLVTSRGKTENPSEQVRNVLDHN